MFVKYRIKGGISDTDNLSHNKILADWASIMNGTHTTTSDFDTDVADVSSCEFVGSANTTIYNDITTNSCTTATDEGWLAVRKRHHHYLTDSNYDMARNIRVGISPNSSDNAGVLVGTKGNTNFRPASSTSFGTVMTPEVNTQLSIQPTFYFYVSDYFFMWQMYNDQGNQSAWGGVLDYEVSNHDKYVYDDIDSNYSAQYTWCGSMAAEFNTQQGSSTQYDCEWFGRQNYYANDGTIFTHNAWSTTTQADLWGLQDAESHTNSFLFPQNQRRIYAAPLSTGDVSHQLIPLIAIPQGGNDKSDPVIPKFPYVWRTTDDIGNPGQTITFDGIDYVVMMGNKTAGSSITDVDRYANACYLFQKTIGGK